MGMEEIAGRISIVVDSMQYIYITYISGHTQRLI